MPKSSLPVRISCESQRGTRVLLIVVATLILMLSAAACGPPPAPPFVPTDAQDACPLPAATFNGWFQGGTVTLNGVVNPANSLVSLAPNCGFYQWSEQMFLWMTSPAPATYGGGGGRIFDSPAFFDVSPPDGSGNRTLLAHSAGLIRAFPIRAAQAGVHGLPVVKDRSGTLFEVRPVNPALKLQVRDQSGKVMAVAHARQGDDRRLVLLDAGGNVISPARATGVVTPTRQNPETNGLIGQKFIVDRFPIFIDPSLAVIDVEQGEADGGVLEAQTAANGSLVYYATMVNDVYAYFLTGVKDGAISTVTPDQFPTTSTDLTNIVNFAMAHGKPNPPFPDPNAMAIEVKSSWVLASGLPNLSNYITMTATVPKYDTSNPALWTPNGQQTVQLALVGIHVVGSTAGHPEMVWATFEQVGNTPLAQYSYNSTTGPKTVPQNTVGTWVFTAGGSSGPFNTPHMFFTGPPANNIQAAMGFSVTPSDTIRSLPWGIAGSNSGSNTEVISMNSHVLGMLASGDVRGNYTMTGATWTPFGSNPVGPNPGVGTNNLANTTMETYQQGTNCFTCHQNTASHPNVTTEISHVFPGLKPLF